MKKDYLEPIAELHYLHPADILTASPEDSSDDFANDVFDY